LKSKIFKILKFTGFFAIGILLLYFAFKDIDIQHLKDDFREAKYSWVLLSLFFAVIAYISRAIRWVLIIEPLGFKPGVRNSFYSLMIGYLANFAFPRIGEITRCATLGKKENIPVDKLVGTVIVERAVDFISLLLLLGVLIVFRFETFGNFFRENVFIPIGEKVSTTFNFSIYIWIILGGSLVIFLIVYLIFRQQLSKLKLIARSKNIIKGIVEGLKTVYTLKKRGLFLIHTLIIWASYWAMTWVVVFSLESTANLEAMDGLFLLVIGGLGMSAPVQSGIGAYHWIVSRGLVAVYPWISIEEGLVFATITHESQSLLAILLGSMSFAMIFRQRKINNLLSGPKKWLKLQPVEKN